MSLSSLDHNFQIISSKVVQTSVPRDPLKVAQQILDLLEAALKSYLELPTLLHGHSCDPLFLSEDIAPLKAVMRNIKKNLKSRYMPLELQSTFNEKHWQALFTWCQENWAISCHMHGSSNAESERNKIIQVLDKQIIEIMTARNK